MSNSNPPPDVPPGFASSESTARLRLTRVRTLNEIAFLASDRAHGGPAREAELAELRRTLRCLDEQLAASPSITMSPLISPTVQVTSAGKSLEK